MPLSYVALQLDGPQRPVPDVEHCGDCVVRLMRSE
jgi:hypothetical protein